MSPAMTCLYASFPAVCQAPIEGPRDAAHIAIGHFLLSVL